MGIRTRLPGPNIPRKGKTKKMVRYQSLNHQKRLGWLGMFVTEAGKASNGSGGKGGGEGGWSQPAEVWGNSPGETVDNGGSQLIDPASMCTQGCPLAPIPLVSTYREAIGTGQAPKSTSTDQAHRPHGDSPATNCLDKITYFHYFSCPSAKWM